MYIPLYLWGMEGGRSKKELGGYLGIRGKNKERRRNIEFEGVREEGQKNQVRINIGCRDYEGRRKSDKVESQGNGEIVTSL